MSLTDIAVLNGIILYDKFIAECYSFYSDAGTKLGLYRVIFNKGLEPEYPEFLYDGRCKIIREKFEKCVNIVNLCLVCFPYLKADY